MLGRGRAGEGGRRVGDHRRPAPDRCARTATAISSRRRSSSSVGPNDEITRSELFGPITCLYRVSSFEEAITLANDSPFGLTASIHTQNINRAMTFLNRIQSGVAVVNGGTYGSEPHLPFGGLRQSGNGWREAGTQAIDVYSDLKTIYINHNPSQAC